LESSVQQLLEYHAQIEWRDRLGNTALHAAATHGRDHVVRALVTVGANDDGLNGGGDTPLHWASFSGHVETATTLLDLDARIHLRNSEGETAMDVARARHRTDIVTVMTQLELLQGSAWHWRSHRWLNWVVLRTAVTPAKRRAHNHQRDVAATKDGSFAEGCATVQLLVVRN